MREHRTEEAGIARAKGLRGFHATEFVSLAAVSTKRTRAKTCLGAAETIAMEFPLQVGGRDFALDLLFFHRGLNCLVAMALGCPPRLRPVPVRLPPAMGTA